MYTRYCHSKLYWLVNGDSTVQTFRILFLLLVLLLILLKWMSAMSFHYVWTFKVVCLLPVLVCMLYIYIESVLYLVYDWLHHTCHSSDTFTVRKKKWIGHSFIGPPFDDFNVFTWKFNYIFTSLELIYIPNRRSNIVMKIWWNSIDECSIWIVR